MKSTLRLIGFIGLALFGLMYAATFLSPIYFERAARDFIRAQVEAQVRNKIDDLGGSSLEKAARRLSTEYEAEIADLRLKLQERLPEKVAAGIAEMQDLSCECRKKLERSIREGFEWRISSLGDAQGQLSSLMQGKYVEVVQKLLLDLRIFSGTNAFVFLLLLIASFVKAGAITHLFLPGILLLVATLVSAYFYLFEQNWFFTLIHNDYVGLGYVFYVSVVFLFLCDVVFNRARVTTEIINQFFHAIGRAASLAPC